MCSLLGPPIHSHPRHPNSSPSPRFPSGDPFPHPLLFAHLPVSLLDSQVQVDHVLDSRHLRVEQYSWGLLEGRNRSLDQIVDYENQDG